MATFGRKIKPRVIKYIVTQWIAPFFFPPDYKWIKIHTNRTYKFYCFGIEMDYYENETNTVFEELYKVLADKGVNVSWTDTTDSYYLQMTQNNVNDIQGGKKGH
jgi:acyl-coenzyme A synthetase/AMP-(fatty) acid ligase